MPWAVPRQDTVTFGELQSELYSVSERDDAHVGDAFIRRGGRVFPSARVASAKPRPFGQRESLTDEADSASDSGALRMMKRSLRAARSFLLDDELAVLHTTLDAAGGAVQRLLKVATGAEDDQELQLQDAQDTQNGESIVDLSWHPTRNLLAVAQLDGVVALYHVESAAWDARVLEHPKQMDIGSIEWGKFTGDTLAVACRAGVFLWKVPKKSGEPVLQEILQHPSNAGFSQVCWNADGSLLAATGKGSRSVVVFDAIFSRKTELQSPYKLSSLHWSPTGEYLFVITENGVSLMWETLTWKRETWEVAAGISSPALDFAEKELFSLDRSTSAIVGGKVQSIAWDPSGSRVAVTYRTTATGSHQAGTGELVAIFSVVWEPFLIFTRSGLLRGPPNAGVPRKLAFASNFKNGALLSIAWSSGLISFHPFYLQDPKAP
uniref:Anaphase-promoting complex subunit 4-like WD40 domain-containing protein n=1 Tax=Phytophthora ramorum TaxID=164328 RepID=H3GNP4_PHYRM